MNESSKNLIDLYEQLGKLDLDFRNNNLYNLVLSKAIGKTFLDVGSGAGHLLARAKSRGMVVWGLEKDHSLISLSKKLYGNVFHIKEGKAEEINRLNLKFNTIAMVDVLEHIIDDELVLRKIIKKISKKGRLIIIVPAFQFLYCQRDRLYGHKRRYSADELSRKLKNGGWEIKELRYWNLLGFFVYLFYEKFLNKRINIDYRVNKPKGLVRKLLHMSINNWMRLIENNINFGLGLSLVCVATPKKSKN